MFFHNLKYTIRILFKSRMMIFWIFAFPIILGTFFNMAFSKIEDGEKLDVVSVAYVENKDYKNNTIFKTAFDSLKDMFDVHYVSIEEAKKLLEDKKVSGIITFDENPEITVNSSGVNETVIKSVVDEIDQSISIANTVADKEIQNGNTNYIEIYTKAYKQATAEYANIKDISSNNLSYTLIEFYTLIAMACLYGGILGMVAINHNLPNMSTSGKRMAISPASKKSLMLGAVTASYITQLIGMALLFLYTIFVLKVDYGSNLFLVIILALAGCLAGLTFGIMIATIFKTNEDTKTGIIIGFTMLGCFLSGMMGITLKYYIDKTVPIVNKLNPASMITDGFYSLYYYDTLDRFYFDLISLLIFSALMIVFSLRNLRRQKYDSI